MAFPARSPRASFDSNRHRCLRGHREKEIYVSSGSPIISAVVFGLSLFLVLVFGGASMPLSLEVSEVTDAVGVGVSLSKEAELPETPPSVRSKYRGLRLDSPKLPDSLCRDDARRVVGVRSTGQVSFVVFDAQGQPAQGVEVELSQAVLSSTLQAYVAQGVTDGTSLVTDDKGRILLPPLPTGSWAWSAISADGSVDFGVFEVFGGALVEVVGVLP